MHVHMPMPMMHKPILLALIASCWFACGGDSNPAVDPNVDEFNVGPAEQEELDDAAANGEGAEGSYSYDETAGVLTLTITSSSFECGPQVGSMTATVENVNASELVLRFEGDSDSVPWTRVDQLGEGLVGIWRTTDPDLFLILASDGSAQIFGEQEICNVDRPRNEQNCLRVEASPANIAIDGDLGDWDAVGPQAAISDPGGDQEGDDPGADLIASKIAYSAGTLSVLSQLAAAPSTAFQNSSAPNSGSYRLVVQGYNGLSVEATLAYSPDRETWEMQSLGGGVSADVGANGIEWSVDISEFLGEGFTGVDFIMMEPRGCDQGACDTVECAYFDL